MEIGCKSQPRLAKFLRGLLWVVAAALCMVSEAAAVKGTGLCEFCGFTAGEMRKDGKVGDLEQIEVKPRTRFRKLEKVGLNYTKSGRLSELCAVEKISGKNYSAAKKEFEERSALWGGEGLADENADEMTVKLWKPEIMHGADTNNEFVEDQNETGYLYQILLKLPDGAPEKDILVQVGGAGELAGIDNGNLSDLTPYTSDHRETFEGKLVLYIRRLSIGDISVSVFERTHDNTKLIRDMCI